MRSPAYGSGSGSVVVARVGRVARVARVGRVGRVAALFDALSQKVVEWDYHSWKWSLRLAWCGWSAKMSQGLFGGPVAGQ